MEFLHECSMGDWIVGLDRFAFVTATKEYIERSEAEYPRSEPVSYTSNERYEKTFIVAHIGRPNWL